MAILIIFRNSTKYLIQYKNGLTTIVINDLTVNLMSTPAPFGDGDIFMYQREWVVRDSYFVNVIVYTYQISHDLAIRLTENMFRCDFSVNLKYLYAYYNNQLKSLRIQSCP